MTANFGSNTGMVESSTPNEPTTTPNGAHRKSQSTKTSEHRRITKPIMEKKRRARINNSLNELKVLILDALNKDPSRHSKLEKADILEMTVRHLQKLQRQQVAAAIANDPAILNKYRAGFSECASEVGRYIGQMDGFDQSFRQRILSHLNHCVNSLNQMTVNAQFGSINTNNNNNNQKPAFPGMAPPLPSGHQLHVQIPFANTNGNLSTSPFLVSSSDINNNNTMTTSNYHRNRNYCSNSPIESSMKPGLSTPPSSASSTTSSHFAFNLSLHSPKLNPISLSTTSTTAVPSSTTTNNHHHHHHLLFRSKHFSSLSSPGSSNGSFISDQMSPMMESDDGLDDMAVDCTIQRMSKIVSENGENVWRPW